jgi:hypothetical protein
MTKHIMVDLETWGTTPGSDIRSIGAVVFDLEKGELGEEFYVNVIGGDRYGLLKDPSTEKWWSEQSEEAQARLRIDQKLLADGLQDFTNWWNRQAGGQDDYVRFWAHGPHFDEQILAAAHRATNRFIPWSYRAPRDLRTILEAAGLDPKTGIPLFGVEHNALDDAKAQALGVIEAYRRLKVDVFFKQQSRDVVRELLGDYATEIKELRDRRDGLLEANNREVERRRALHAAGYDLYYAGRWSCDRPVDEAALWIALRDAMGLEPGTATALGMGRTAPSRYDELAAAARKLRQAQRDYMNVRSTNLINAKEIAGRAVADAAAELDAILGDA